MRWRWPAACCTCSGPGCWCWPTAPTTAPTFLAEVAGTGAHVLAAGPKPPAAPRSAACSPTGPTCHTYGGLDVRIIEASVTITGADGSHTRDRYRLITTLADPCRYPAAVLVRLYHERWEIESAYYALRHTLLGGRLLRSGDRPGLEQETWALLALYQLLRMAMTDATATRPGTDPDPDRASFTTALQTARDQLASAAGITPAPPPCPASSAKLSWPPCLRCPEPSGQSIH